MSDWNPALYARFEDERSRPAAELLARVRLEAPTLVVDLGCGPGNSMQLLLERYPAARIIGIDTSEAMLAAARQRLPSVLFRRLDIADWCPAEPLDLAYANAALQWVPNHERLLAQLTPMLARGGILAFQEWLRSTGLKPFIEALTLDRQEAFLAEYERRIDAAYPPGGDGKRLLAFPRLFVVAQRRAS